MMGRLDGENLENIHSFIHSNTTSFAIPNIHIPLGYLGTHRGRILSYPLILEPAALAKLLDDEELAQELLIVDLCKPEIYQQAHIPGAVHLEYKQIITSQAPAMGLIPDEPHLSATLSLLGLTNDHHVVAYDDEGGGRAARFLWTLDALGHSAYSLLNGGLHAWSSQQLPLTREVTTPKRSNYEALIKNNEVAADLDYIKSRLNDSSVILLDCRTPAEYSGQKKRADRTGHIPGAINFDWVNALDLQNALRLKPDDKLTESLALLGITPDKEIIVYCHTHHRSAHTYLVLKNLGFPNVKGYPGSWSQWGNRPDVPVE